MTVELFDYGSGDSAEQRGGKSFCSNQEGFTEERAFEQRFQRGFFMQRTHRLLPRPGGLSIEGFEPESIEEQRRRAEGVEGDGSIGGA